MKSSLMVIADPVIGERIEQCRADIQTIIGKPCTLHLVVVNDVDSVAYLEQIICEIFSITSEEIRSKSRKERIKDARHFFCYYLKTTLGLGPVAIGRIVNKDHTSAIHSCRTIENLLSIHDTQTMRYNKILIEKLQIK
jgi:chromosomal replication initiation ATPase DnaA